MKKLFFSFFISSLFLGCLKFDLPRDNPRDGKTVPSVRTNVVTNLTGNSVTGNGEVLGDGGAPISERGIVFSTSSSLTIATGNVAKAATAGIGQYTVSISGLLPNTRYFYAAYATNLIGTSYGIINNFTTPASSASLITSAPSQVTVSSAVSGGTINSDGGSQITAKGVCWSLTAAPTVALSTRTNDGIGVAAFTSNINNLNPNTTYYVRAYATNSAGTTYGNEFSFQTLANLPTFTAFVGPSTSNLTATGLSVTSQIINEGGAPVTQKGVCWSTSSNPTISDSRTSDGPTNGILLFNSSVTGLLPGTTYNLRAYATNIAGTSYSPQVTFTTRSNIPTITTSQVSNILISSAISGGNISSDGGAAVTQRGVCWSTNVNPTISNNRTIDGTGTGGFTSSMTGLAQLTTYYVRAYATNSQGTAYGNEITFQTSNTSIPSVVTGSVGAVTAFSATLTGNNVTDNGNVQLAERGVFWGESPGVNASNNKVTDLGTTIGTFNTTITGLQPGKIYYARAFARNSLGTGLGIERSFSTSIVLPTVGSTSAASSITTNSAISGGNITSDGGSNITIRGVCWSTTTSPTVNLNTRTNNGTGTGTFSSTLTGLASKTTYFVRAYATNSLGTSYGPEISFTTQ